LGEETSNEEWTSTILMNGSVPAWSLP